eukprot:1395419-Amorphochlora_amoeboformis.AAC.1
MVGDGEGSKRVLNSKVWNCDDDEHIGAVTQVDTLNFLDSGASKGEKGGKREEGGSGSTSTEGKKTAFRAPRRGPRSKRSPNGSDFQPRRSSVEQLVFNILEKKHKKKAVTREEVEKHNTKE